MSAHCDAAGEVRGASHSAPLWSDRAWPAAGSAQCVSAWGMQDTDGAVRRISGFFLTEGTECEVVTGVDDHSRFCVMSCVVPRAGGVLACARGDVGKEGVRSLYLRVLDGLSGCSDRASPQTIAAAHAGDLRPGMPRGNFPHSPVLPPSFPRLVLDPFRPLGGPRGRQVDPIRDRCQRLFLVWWRLVCLAGLSALPQVVVGQGPGFGGEACALVAGWCLTTCLTTCLTDRTSPKAPINRHWWHGRVDAVSLSRLNVGD
jgi:hypothetical protein